MVLRHVLQQIALARVPRGAVRAGVVAVVRGVVGRSRVHFFPFSNNSAAPPGISDSVIVDRRHVDGDLVICGLFPIVVRFRRAVGTLHPVGGPPSNRAHGPPNGHSPSTSHELDDQLGSQETCADGAEW